MQRVEGGNLYPVGNISAKNVWTEKEVGPFKGFGHGNEKFTEAVLAFLKDKESRIRIRRYST